MEPTIGWGDFIVITKPPEELKPGMIVTMQVKDKIVTHRVLEVDPLVTQGDANGTPDTWKPEDVRVVGVVRLCIPKLGGLLGAIHLAGLGSNAWFRDSERLPGEVSAGHWEAIEEDAMGAPDAEATLQARDLSPETSDVGMGAELSLTSDPVDEPGESAPPPDAEAPNSVGVETPTVPSTVLDPVEPSSDSSPPTAEDDPTEAALPAEDPVP